MKQTPLARRTPPLSHTGLRRRARLAAVSPRRRRELDEYRRLRDAFLAGRPVCELCDAAPATEVHHKRGRVGALYLLVDLWAALCSPCHRWVTEHPAEAVRLGISQPRIGGN